MLRMDDTQQETTEQKVQAGLKRARDELGVLDPRTVNESRLAGVLGEVIDVVGLLALPRISSQLVRAALEGAKSELQTSKVQAMLHPSAHAGAHDFAHLVAAVEELVAIVEALVAPSAPAINFPEPTPAMEPHPFGDGTGTSLQEQVQHGEPPSSPSLVGSRLYNQSREPADPQAWPLRLTFVGQSLGYTYMLEREMSDQAVYRHVVTDDKISVVRAGDNPDEFEIVEAHR